jgi:hypothetical protein
MKRKATKFQTTSGGEVETQSGLNFVALDTDYHCGFFRKTD